MDIKLYPALNRMFQFREVRKVLQQAVPKKSESYITPFITIAREPGSGGRPIAKLVAERLGYDFVDKQLVTDIAHSVKRRQEIIKQIDEKGRSAIQDMVHATLNPEFVNQEIYTRELFKALLAYAYKGRVVILGRGGNFVTPFAKGLHVRITAPYEVRVQRAIDYEGFDRAHAKQVIAEVEKERREFITQYIKTDARKANAYDLTLNTTYFQIDEAANVIIEAFYSKFSRSLKRPRD